ncbi:MAG: MBL fold metallo-hydrolase [Lachnospiraceae bacterium]|nr:MBL fold metallo-hydrolase [Lachnospiraceae bacterium]
MNTFFTSNTYVLSHSDCDYVWLVDCGDYWKVKKLLNGKSVMGVLMSHTHADHIYGLNELLSDFSDTVIYTNEFGRTALYDPKLNITKYHEKTPDFVVLPFTQVRTLKEGDKFELFPSVRVKVLETLGHDKSCLSYIIGENLFTGDSYIPTAKLTAKFPNSNKNEALAQYDRLKTLGEKYIVRPGHGPTK